MAQFNLGRPLLFRSRGYAGLPQAYAWILKAAEQGLPDAQVQLGVMYMKGQVSLKMPSKQSIGTQKQRRGACTSAVPIGQTLLRWASRSIGLQAGAQLVNQSRKSRSRRGSVGVRHNVRNG